MLKSRLLISALLIPALIALLVVDAKLGPAAPVLFGLCALIALRCSWELLALLKRPTIEPRFGPVAACILVLLVVTWAPYWLPLVGATADQYSYLLRGSRVLALSVLVLMAIRAIRFREPGGHLPSLAAEVFAVTYIGLLLCLTATLRWKGPAPDYNGYLALGSLIFATKMGDVGAYTLGRLYGKRKMSPHLSPGKTWMGALGAVLGGIIGAALWLHLLGGLFRLEWDHSHWPFTILFGAAMAIVGLIGDLCESLIKRDAEVKDSGSLMPGFGGLLDLLDSILYAGPVALLLWQWFHQANAM